MALKQYKVGSTYYGYDPLSGQGVAAPDEATLKQYFPNGIDPTAGDLTVDPTLFNANPGKLVSGPVDGASLAKAAADAGMSVDDFKAALAGATAAGDRTTVEDNLGIPALEDTVNNAVAPSTEKLFNDAYTAAGLGDVKTQLAGLDTKISTRKSALNTALGSVNENPWLDEASRVGRGKNLQELANGDIQGYLDEQSQLKDLYNTGLNEVNGLVTRQTTDFGNTTAANQQKLAALEAKAAQQESDLASEKAARYLPDYLNATAANAAAQKPDTISGPDGSQYAWDPTGRTFVQVVAPRVTTPEQTPEEKQIAAFQSDAAGYIEQLGSNKISWASAWNALHAKYPNASNELIDNTLGKDAYYRVTGPK